MLVKTIVCLLRFFLCVSELFHCENTVTKGQHVLNGLYFLVK